MNIKKNISSLFILIIIITLVSCADQSNNKSQVIVPESETTDVTEPATKSNDYAKSEELESDRRKSWQKPDLVISALGNIDDKVIADLGAGIGYFSFKLISLCEKVIAIDIDPEAIEVLEGFKSTMTSAQQEKLDIRHATPDNPMLNKQEVDIVFIVNTIGFIGQRRAYLKNLVSGLKEGGEIVIVDFKSKRLPDYVDAPAFEDRVYMHILEEDLEVAGLENVIADDTTLEYQYIISATKK